MSTEIDTQCGAVSGEDVALAAIALHARLRETDEQAFYCRPLPRREIARLARIVKDYARLARIVKDYARLTMPRKGGE